MEIQSKLYKNTKDVVNRTLYQINNAYEIVFEEKQSDETVDILKAKFYPNNTVSFFYAKEYIPSIVDRKGAKDVDVTIIRIHKETKSIIYRAIDLKRNLITNAKDEDSFHNIDITYRTISHLLSQWQDAYTYAKLFQTIYDTHELQFIPYVVTRRNNIDELKQLIHTYKKQREEDKSVHGILAIKKQRRDITVNKEIKLLQMFSEGVVELHEEFFEYEILVSEKEDYQYIHHISIE